MTKQLKKQDRSSRRFPRPMYIRESANEFVTDTHSLMWHMWEAPRLSGTARQTFMAADRGEAVIYIPIMCLVEIVYLCESKKILDRSYERLLDLTGEPDSSYEIVSLSIPIVNALWEVPRKVIPDLPDRTIAATALSLKLPLITKDEAIRGWDGITTIW